MRSFRLWPPQQSYSKKLLGEEELSLKKALEIAHGMEIANQKASEFDTSVESKMSDDVMMIPSAKTPCYRCNKVGHSPDSCYFRKQKCRSCGKIGHIAKACQTADKKHTTGNKKPENKRTRKKDTVSMVTETITESEPGDVPLLAIQSPGNKIDSRIKVQLEIQGVKMTMELDTGVSVSIISSRVYKENFSEIPLQKSDTTLRIYTGEPIKVLGMFNAEVKCEEQQYSLPLLVVDGDGPSLFGCNCLSSITLDWKSIKHLSTGLDSLLQKYKEIFKDELGTLKGVYSKLVVKQDATPKFFKLRSVPYSLKEAIERDLKRLQKLGVVEKVNTVIGQQQSYRFQKKTSQSTSVVILKLP